MARSRSSNGLKARRLLGKYRLVRHLNTGGFCEVWQAYDRVENLSVALKVPINGRLDEVEMKRFQRETRLTASLDHPNIALLKNAEFIDDLLVATYPLGKESLADRLQRRLGTAHALKIAEELLEALSYAHDRGIIHCDVKPENILLFDSGRTRLTDFGISKIAAQSVVESGLGTVGFYAPEQAFGRPTRASDVFSAGLVIWRMLSGTLPEWPFAWPPPGLPRVYTKVDPALVRVLRRAMAVKSARRYPTAGEMLTAFRRAAELSVPAKKKARKKAQKKAPTKSKPNGRVRRSGR